MTNIRTNQTLSADVPLSVAPLPPVDRAIPPWSGEYVEVTGHRLFVRYAGHTSPKVTRTDTTTSVYLHGLGGSSTNWTDLAGQLRDYSEAYIPDFPGFGKSEPVDGFDFSMTTHTDLMANFIAGLNSGPVHLIGNSMGGAIALMLAANKPDLVKTLTLISPAMPDLRPFPGRLSDARIPLAFLPLVGDSARRKLDAVSPRERVERILRTCFANPELMPENRIAESVAEIEEHADRPWAQLAIGRSAISLIKGWIVAGPRSMWTLPSRVAVPTLVIWGAKDKVVSVRKASRLTRLLPQGKMLVLPNTGHVAQMERPAEVAQAILGMWEKARQHAW